MIEYIIFDEKGEEFYPEWTFETRIIYGSFIYIMNAETVKEKAANNCWIWKSDPLENNKLYYIRRFGPYGELMCFDDIDRAISEAEGIFKQKLKNAKEIIENFNLKRRTQYDSLR